jgi:hypothetical protein
VEVAQREALGASSGRTPSDRYGSSKASFVHQPLDGSYQVSGRSIYVNVGVGTGTGERLAFINQNYRQSKISPDAAHKLGPFHDGKSVAYDCHVEPAGTTQPKDVFKGDCGHYIKACPAKRTISAAH